MVLMECGCLCHASFSAHVRLQLPFVWSVEARVSAHRGVQKGERNVKLLLKRKPRPGIVPLDGRGGARSGVVP